MEENYYMINMQSLLYIVSELHTRGYQKLRLIPSVSPTGLSWRCNYLAENTVEQVIASNWLNGVFNISEKQTLTISELTDRFESEHIEFVKSCSGRNEEYVDWYNQMLNQLQVGELPYSYSDYFSPTDFWSTSANNEIKTLPYEIKYYLDYTNQFKDYTQYKFFKGEENSPFSDNDLSRWWRFEKDYHTIYRFSNNTHWDTFENFLNYWIIEKAAPNSGHNLDRDGNPWQDDYNSCIKKLTEDPIIEKEIEKRVYFVCRSMEEDMYNLQEALKVYDVTMEQYEKYKF